MSQSLKAEYTSLLKEKGIEIRSWATFGQRQGDYAAIVTANSKVGFVVIGYGSCSGCDAYAAATDGTTGEERARLLTDLAYSIINSIFWGTLEELDAKIQNQGNDNNWYRHEESFKNNVNRLRKATRKAFPATKDKLIIDPIKETS